MITPEWIEELITDQNKSLRTEINYFVRKYADKKHLNIRAVWRILYSRFEVENKMAVISKKGCKLDYIEGKGKMPALWQLANKLFN